MKKLYLPLAVIGFVLPYYFFVSHRKRSQSATVFQPTLCQQHIIVLCG